MKAKFLVAAMLFCAIASMSHAAVTVLPGGSSVAGKTIGEWTADWWNWTGSVPGNVFSDTTGALATQNQSGTVFFVAGTQGGAAVTRSFEIPGDKHVLFPLINIIVANGPDPGFAGTEEEATAFVDAAVNPAQLFANLDGVDVADLASHREKSPVNFTYNVTAESGTFPPGSFTDANSDGYWLMLAPLAPGNHVLRFGGTSNEFVGPDPVLTVPSFTVDVTANATVPQGPGTVIPLPPAVLGAIPMFAAAWATIRGSRRRQVA